eukprot:981247-Prorocentrum_minimum.AAC.1
MDKVWGAVGGGLRTRKLRRVVVLRMTRRSSSEMCGASGSGRSAPGSSTGMLVPPSPTLVTCTPPRPPVEAPARAARFERVPPNSSRRARHASR